MEQSLENIPVPEHAFTSGHFREALRLLGVYTAGRFDVWLLAGPAKASCRAHIASELAGRRVPQSKAGVTAIRDSFYWIVKPQGDCLAAREDSFVSFAVAFLAENRSSLEAAERAWALGKDRA